MRQKQLHRLPVRRFRDTHRRRTTSGLHKNRIPNLPGIHSPAKLLPIQKRTGTVIMMGTKPLVHPVLIQRHPTKLPAAPHHSHTHGTKLPLMLRQQAKLRVNQAQHPMDALLPANPKNHIQIPILRNLRHNIKLIRIIKRRSQSAAVRGNHPPIPRKRLPEVLHNLIPGPNTQNQNIHIPSPTTFPTIHQKTRASPLCGETKHPRP